mmetsp:Transcript_138566/g.430947  ORF Transcript_138566/g.430947 Transcript_138566/m.430947 type:complete len:278 (+) Transcript_138566:847-1680(+)
MVHPGPGPSNRVMSEHGATSFVFPKHHLPLPLPYASMRRERRFTPSHEQEHAPHCVQALNWQSLSAEQPCELQYLSSLSLPCTGLPHCEACASTFLVRHWRPPPQAAEQAPQTDQSPQLPSMQTWAPQGCVLQGTISLFTSAGHFLPSPFGATLIWRSRVFWPPPQLQVQALHCVQSSHWQSVPFGQTTFGLQFVMHRLVSMRLTLQGKPHSLLGCAMPRWRTQRPVQSPSLHPLQSDTSQSSGVQLLWLQGACLHGAYRISFPSHAACLLMTHQEF